MEIILEILQALACAASIARTLFELLERWRNYKHQRMDSEDSRRTGGNRPF